MHLQCLSCHACRKVYSLKYSGGVFDRLHAPEWSEGDYKRPGIAEVGGRFPGSPTQVDAGLKWKSFRGERDYLKAVSIAAASSSKVNGLARIAFAPGWHVPQRSEIG
jgi:hypothetical protein